MLFCLHLYSVSSVLISYLYHRNCNGMLYCSCSGIRCNFTSPNVNHKYIIPVQVNKCTVLMKTALYTILQFKDNEISVPLVK